MTDKQTAIPREIRNIFSEWAKDFEAGERKLNMATPGYKRGQLPGFFHALAYPAAQVIITPDNLDLVRKHARTAAMSPLASVRAEAKQVQDWLDTLN